MQDAVDIMNWYILCGIEDICSDTPCNVLLPKKNSPQEKNIVLPQGKVNRPATTLLAQENGAACHNARELCRQAQTLDDLRALLESFDGCSLKFSANSTVFGYGNPKAEVMFIGEAPGADEDRQGEPFVGRSGHLLNKMIAAVGLRREDCYITNILPWRPPGNRTPTDAEVAVCMPFLKRQIELISPKIIFLLGASAANAVLDNADSISNLRGHIIDYRMDNGQIIPTLSSYHPAFLLRSSVQKSKAWSDFLRLRRKLNE